MFKSLRRRIVLIEIGAFLVVAVLIIGTININSYIQMIDAARETLQMIADNDGLPPKFDSDKSDPAVDASELRKLLESGFGLNVTEETQYTTRYFFAVVDSEGGIVSSDMTHIASVSEENLNYYVSSALANRENEGSVAYYRFLKTADGDNTVIYFLDYYNSARYVSSVLTVSIVISVICMAIVTVFVYIFSGIVIRPLEKNYQKQKRFITDAGHELKTPITAISANIDVLTMRIGQDETIDRIKRQLQNLSGLVAELLTLSKTDSEEPQSAKIERIKLSELIISQSPTFEIPAKEQNKSFSLQIDPDISVKADEKDMKRLYSVLADNAVKYCTANGNITVSLQKSGRYVKLLVTNTCPPISQEDIAHLFDRFYRSDASRSRETGGYGIGLSIAQAVTDKYRGKIRVYNGDGIVCFEVLLPE